MGFLTNFFKVQGKNLKTAINQAAVSFDAEAATEAEIRTFEDSFNELLVKLGQAKTAYDREVAEAKIVRDKYEKYISAAERLNAKVESGSASDDEKAALADLLKELEVLVPEMDREEAEAAEAKEYLDEIKATAEVMRDKLLTSKKSLDTARKDMEKAALQKERESIKAENAAQLAGLRESTSALGDASKAMLEKADKDRAEAEAMRAKAEMLSPISTKSKVLDKYLNDDAPTTSASMSDRLKALKR